MQIPKMALLPKRRAASACFAPDGHILRTPELVIFDCDGVLADSEVISAEVLISELHAFGITLDTHYVFRNFVGKSFPGVAASIRATYQVVLPADFEDRYRAALLAAFATQLRATAGVQDMLAKLNCQTCVATSSSPPRVQKTLELIDLTDRFGADVFTASQVKRGKPAPDLFLFAAQKMGALPENCLVIEDSTAGLTAALAANMPVWRYIGGSHFLPQSHHRPETPAGVPVFDNWDEFYLMMPELRA